VYDNTGRFKGIDVVGYGIRLKIFSGVEEIALSNAK
jgi:hypothetical protein